MISKPMNGGSMLNRYFIFSSFCLLSLCTLAQQLRIQKTGSNITMTVHLPQRIAIVYEKNNAITVYRGKAVNYRFPYLYFLSKNKDSLKVDVRNITQMRLHNRIGILKVVGLAFATAMTIATIHDIIKGDFIAGEIFVPIGIDFGFYALVRIFPRLIDTKTEWSFY